MTIHKATPVHRIHRVKLINAGQQLEGARQILKDMEKDRTNRSLTPNHW